MKRFRVKDQQSVLLKWPLTCQWNNDKNVENEMTYVCRKISEDRWLYVTADEERIVGGIIREGIRRYRIQLPLRDGTLLSHPIVFERFKTADRILRSKLESDALWKFKVPAPTTGDGEGCAMAALVGR